MKKTLLTLAICACGTLAFAQQALGPGTGIVSPEINADNTVTFRYINPKAVTVQVTGDMLTERSAGLAGGRRFAVLFLARWACPPGSQSDKPRGYGGRAPT